jgi:SAM-dependent methyltransferase
MSALRTADEIRDVNTRYHDVAADSYDTKWGIDFGEVGRGQVIGKLRKVLGPELEVGFDRSLEIGAGTGYFSLNLLQEGIVEHATCTDISPGMVATLARNADRLGVPVRAARADAESLPFADASFDLVLGHAVLHHLPNLRRAFAEFHRVLRPGGWIAFAGEPSRVGDRIAALPKRGAGVVAPAWRLALRAAPAPPLDGTAGDDHQRSARVSDHELERLVDIHAFDPDDLLRHARRAGFIDARAGSTARWRQPRIPTMCRCSGASSRFTATWRSSALTSGCSRAGYRRRCSTTCCCRPGGGDGARRARGGVPAVSAGARRAPLGDGPAAYLRRSLQGDDGPLPGCVE